MTNMLNINGSAEIPMHMLQRLYYDNAMISAMQNYYGINDVHALTSFFQAAGLVNGDSDDDGG
ncbi:MAG TPA: hypothetical protein VF016_06925 [Nitrososphaera sp.]